MGRGQRGGEGVIEEIHTVAFGYVSNCGRKTSKTLMRSNMGDHDWLITSRQTLPDLRLHGLGFSSWVNTFKDKVEGHD